MKKDNFAIASLWTVICMVLIAAAWIGLRSTIDNVSKIVVAIIGAAAVILSAILTHALAQARELAFEQQKQRQANYGDLLKQVGDFIRRRDAGDDKFDTAHLYSWVVGSEEVIKATQAFMLSQEAPDLKALLVAMRSDAGLPPVNAGLELPVFNTQTTGLKAGRA